MCLHVNCRHMTKTKTQKLRAKLAKKVVVKNPIKKLEKAIGKAVTVKGSGDYRPTKFARVKGKGDYSSTLGNVGRLVGGLGDLGSSLFSAITGSGDYKSKARVMHDRIKTAGDWAEAVQQELSPGIANAGSMQMGAMNVQFNGGAPRVRHREFITKVNGTTAFSTTPYRIQPGLQGVNTLFPWGSSVSNCFQQYKLHGMILEYVSTSSDFTSNTGLGSVMMSTLYDATATPLSTQLSINNNEFTTTEKPTLNFIHPLELATEASPVVVRYIRNSNSVQGSSTDDRLDDVGLFQISTVGMPNDGQPIGELWATYDIELLKPNLPDLHLGTTWVAQFQLDGATGATTAPVVSYNENNSLPATVTFGANSTVATVQMPVNYNGSYLVATSVAVSGDVNITGSSSFGAAGTDITGLNLFQAYPGAATIPQPMQSLTLTQAGSPTTQSLALMLASFSTIAENAGENEFTLNFLTSAAGGATPHLVGTIMIIPLDNDFSGPLDLFTNGRVSSLKMAHELFRLKELFEQLVKNPAVLSVPQPEAPSDTNVSLPYVLDPSETAYVIEPSKLVSSLTQAQRDELRRVLVQEDYISVTPSAGTSSSAPSKLTSSVGGK